jgi:4-hydroxy-2-oxoheptanedioate aldolase
MKPAQKLRAAINSDQLVTGLLLTDHIWPQMVESCQRAGLDYIIVDCEHGPHDLEMIARVCQIGRLLDFPVLIRPISCNYDHVRKIMDLGPCGLMLPAVDSVDQLEQLREAIHMPPRGRRRPGGLGNYWINDFNYGTWKEQVEDELIILPQIETVVGLNNVESIAAHDLVTAIAIGPYDLSAELGCCYDTSAEVWNNAIERIREAGRAAGKNMWMIGDGPTWAARGFNFLCIGEPISMIGQTMAGAVNASRQAGEAAGFGVYGQK